MIFIIPTSSFSIKLPVNKILKTGVIVQNLKRCGFVRSHWHRTVGKLQELQRLSVQQLGDRQKYDGYLGFFKAIYDDVALPSKIFTLILPEAKDLMDMDLSILNQNIPLIRQNFVHRNTCDLRGLIRLYSDFPKELQPTPPKDAQIE